MKTKYKLPKFPKLKKPIFIEGLPGIGHVGKLAIDFIIEEMKAKKFLEVYSHSFPNLVFVNEKNLVELPTVKFYYIERKGKAKQEPGNGKAGADNPRGSDRGFVRLRIYRAGSCDRRYGWRHHCSMHLQS